MSRSTRSEVFDPGEIEIAHVTNRTVRRCFLFGDDPLTGKNFDHRKIWIEKHLQHFAAHFGIDLIAFAILSNHFHLILRTRPDIVASWDDTEVARRWMMICPKRKDSEGNPLPPSESELNLIRNCPDKLQEIRTRLSNLSWWMRLMCQRIAQRANREEEESGRFFQDRFKAVRLIDESSLLACSAYVDLNPIRAALAETLEDSEFTSVRRRIEALMADGVDNNDAVASTADKRGRFADSFLSPIELNEGSGATGLLASTSGRRCSDKGFLWFSVEQYLELLDWTARQLAKGKPGKTPEHLAPIMQRLGLSSSTWCDLVANFGRLFHNIAGEPTKIDAERSHRTNRRFHVRTETRELFLAA